MKGHSGSLAYISRGVRTALQERRKMEKNAHVQERGGGLLCLPERMRAAVSECT